ncbi:MAG: SUF system Fe-S cluster assembly regulator [Bryobacteraceae bacterium]
MLRLTKKADYGLIAMTHLAVAREGQAVSAKEIADSYHIPLPLLAKILQKLARRSLLASVHGTNGGYRLAKDPGEISALEIIRAIDGPVALTSCGSAHSGCNQSAKCTVREPLRVLHEGIVNLLAGITVSDLSKDMQRNVLTVIEKL